MTFKDDSDMYKEFKKLLPDVMKEMNTTPEELGIEMDKSLGTVWDINPQSRHKWHNIHITSKCYKCGNNIDGYIVLDKIKLDIVDTKSFILFDEGTMCTKCANS